MHATIKAATLAPNNPVSTLIEDEPWVGRGTIMRSRQQGAYRLLRELNEDIMGAKIGIIPTRRLGDSRGIERSRCRGIEVVAAVGVPAASSPVVGALWKE